MSAFENPLDLRRAEMLDRAKERNKSLSGASKEKAGDGVSTDKRKAKRAEVSLPPVGSGHRSAIIKKENVKMVDPLAERIEKEGILPLQNELVERSLRALRSYVTKALEGKLNIAFDKDSFQAYIDSDKERYFRDSLIDNDHIEAALAEFEQYVDEELYLKNISAIHDPLYKIHSITSGVTEDDSYADEQPAE